jgi:chitinase
MKHTSPRSYRSWAILLLVVFLGAPVLLAQQRTQSRKILGGYFEEWSIYGANYNVANLQQNGVADRLSHLLYAFANVTPGSGAAPDAQCHLADPWADYQNAGLPSVSGQPYTQWPFGNFGGLIQLKQLHPGLKVLISLGGASAANTAGFAFAASTELGREQLAASCIDMFIKGNVGTDWSGNPVSTGSLFDGIDVDWEFPAAADKQNFTLLMREFRRQLNALGKQNGKHYLLTMFAPAGAQNYSNMELAKVAHQVDFMNVQGYDLHGTWESSTNHASSLFDSRQDPSFGQGLFVEAVIQAYLGAGVPARKLVLGVPLYGYGWMGVPPKRAGLYQDATGPATSPAGDTLATNGVATYSTLVNLAGFDPHFDTKRIAHWIYSPAAQTFWTFDDPLTVKAKMVYVQARVPGGLGGAYVWAVKDDDANGTMMKTMADGLGR